MIQLLLEHWGTILVCLLILAIVALCLRSMVRDKKSGKSGCGCSCDGCNHCSCGGEHPTHHR